MSPPSKLMTSAAARAGCDHDAALRLSPSETDVYWTRTTAIVGQVVARMRPTTYDSTSPTHCGNHPIVDKNIRVLAVTTHSKTAAEGGESRNGPAYCEWPLRTQMERSSGR